MRERRLHRNILTPCKQLGDVHRSASADFYAECAQDAVVGGALKSLALEHLGADDSAGDANEREDAEEIITTPS